jgi:hypothetical protein
VPLAVLKELDALVQPYLLALYRDALKIPGNRSFYGGYWVSRPMGVKFSLRTGAIMRLKDNLIVPCSSALHIWTAMRNEYFTVGAETLRAWALEQQGKPIVEPEHPFHESPEMLQIIFWTVMFSDHFKSLDYKYRSTARDLWKVFSRLHGPVCTQRLPDFNSSYRMKRFLRWCLENPPQDFSLASHVEHKTEIFEVRDLWMQPNPETLAKLKVYGKPLLNKWLEELRPSDDETLYNKMMEERLRVPEIRKPLKPRRCRKAPKETPVKDGEPEAVVPGSLYARLLAHQEKKGELIFNAASP